MQNEHDVMSGLQRTCLLHSGQSKWEWFFVRMSISKTTTSYTRSIGQLCRNPLRYAAGWRSFYITVCIPDSEVKHTGTYRRAASACAVHDTNGVFE